MFHIPHAESYGAVLVNAKGEFLLVQPAGYFGGYFWTFPKGRPISDEAPAETALRHVFNKTGYRAELLEVIPQIFVGTTTTCGYFLAGPTGTQSEPSSEISATCWVSAAEAADLIRQTKTEAGRDRDMSILMAAQEAHSNLPWAGRPATCKEVWETSPLPSARTEFSLDLEYDDSAMTKIRKGFLPKGMEHKWFAWYEEPVLHLHRSWTGNCIFQVRFVHADGRWRAVTAEVNRNPEQYSQTDVNEDRHLVEVLIDELLLHSPQQHYVDPFTQALTIATQPNYLGSPEVVSGLIQQVMEAAVSYSRRETNFNAVWDLIWNMSQEISTGTEYVRMAGWHTPQALGQALITKFGVRAEEGFNNDLDYFVSEALMALFLKARDLVDGYSADPSSEWNPHALEQLNALHHWAVTVFIGTNELTHPGVTIAEFKSLKLDEQKR